MNYRRTWDPRVEKYQQIKEKGLVRLTTLHQAINNKQEPIIKQTEKHLCRTVASFYRLGNELKRHRPVLCKDVVQE